MAHRGHDARPTPDGETLKCFLDAGPVVAFIRHPDGHYVYQNPAMGRFGADPFELAGGQPEHADDIHHWRVVTFAFDDPAGRRLTGGLAMDVADLQASRAQLTESERRYRHLVESGQGLICTHDLQGRLLSVNPAALTLTGFTTDQVVGRDMREILGDASRDVFSLYLERIGHIGTDEGLMHVRSANGRELVWKYRNVKVEEAGQAPYVLGHAQDVTELREAQEQLRQLAMTDDLTALFNRRGFFVNGSRLLLEVVRNQKGAAIFYVDIDGLKTINDSHGHDAGSALIVSAAGVLQHSFRAADVLARIGGDEFVVFAVVPPGDVSTIRKRLSWHVHKFNATSGLPYALSMSIGVALFDPARHHTLESLVKDADKDMYHQKRASAEEGGEPGQS